MVQFGYITMFAAVSPISCLLALLANLLEIKYGIYFDSKYLQRNISHKSTGIGSWQRIWEFLTILSIVSNLLVSYFVFIRLRSQYGNFVWVLILIQHLLVLIRSALIFSPSSKAKWVMHLIRKKQFDDNQNKKLKEVLTQKKIKKLQKQLQKQEKANNSLRVNYKNLKDDQERRKKVIEKQENEIQKLQLQIQYQSLQPGGSRRLSNFASLASPNISFQKRGSIKFDKRSYNQGFFQKLRGHKKSLDSDKESQSEEHERAAVDLVKNQHILEQAYRNTRAQPGDITELILQNIALQQLASTYTRIQKQYLTNRIGLISKFSSKSSPIILCQQCSKNQAMYLCRQCKDNLCQLCFTDIHYRSKLNHFKFFLAALGFDQSKQQIQQQKSTFYRQQQSQSFKDNSFEGRRTNRVMSALSTFTNQQEKWIKMQQFSFPTNKDMLYHSEIVSYFKFLIQEYIYKNFINQKRENGRVINLELFFLHRCRTALLSQTMLQQIDYHLYQASKLSGSNFPHLNDEEKIFLNRIVYRLLQQSLISARYMFEEKIQDQNKFDQFEKQIVKRLNSKRNPTFSEFLKDVKKLQNGTFKQKVLFFSYLMDTNSNGMIKKTDLKQFLSTLMIQKIPGNFKTVNQKARKQKAIESLQVINQGSEQIINLIFDSAVEELGGIRSKNQIGQNVLVEVIINNQRVKRAMEAVLQQIPETFIFGESMQQTTIERQNTSLLRQADQPRRQNQLDTSTKVRFQEGLNPKRQQQNQIRQHMQRSYPNRFF